MPKIFIFKQRWANNSVFEYIRIVRTEYIRKPNYSVLFKNRIIFVFVFGFNFQTECIRIRIRFLFLNRIHSYSYSVFIFEPNIFVFVFGFYFWTEYIRIRIRFIFRNRIVFAFSGKLKIYIHFYADEIDYTKHIFFSESYYQYISDFNDIITDDDDDFNIFERQYISRKEKAIINLDLFVWLFKCIINLSTREDAQSHWLHFLVFSYVSSNGLSDGMHSCIRCICLAFLLCVFSNVPSKLLHTKIYNHTDCICVTFLHCGFSNVHSNCLPVRI